MFPNEPPTVPPTVVDSPLDAAIAKSQAEQPKTLEEVLSVVDTLPPTEQKSSTPAPPPDGPLVSKVLNKTHDSHFKLTEDGVQETKVLRKYRDYVVIPMGASISAGMKRKLVTHCTDESEAKRVYYEAYGVGGNPSGFPTRVEAAPVETAA